MAMLLSGEIRLVRVPEIVIGCIISSLDQNVNYMAKLVHKWIVFGPELDNMVAGAR